MILLDCLYINNSGGKALLDYLIEELHQSNADVFYLIDERCKGSYPFLKIEKTIYLKASLKSRHQFFKVNKDKFNTVLCFANLPPTIRLQATVYTYFHNLLLIDQPTGYPLKSKVKAKLKGIVISWNKKNTDYFIVQSENVKKSLINYLNFPENNVLVIPFYRPISISQDFSSKKDEFIYISNGNPHKNHVTLLKAWEIMAEQFNRHIPLHLTITEEYPALLSLIEEYTSKGILIYNHGKVDVKELYSKYKYTVYPSLIESFGLGIAEAIEADCEVIGADLPYMHAVIKPTATFNPVDPKNLAEVIMEVFKNQFTKKQSSLIIKNQINDLILLIKNKNYNG
jgi:glycosyltransferase involved in cell wall biosynthesis